MSPSTRLSKPIDYLLVDDYNKRREVRTVLVNANILDPKPMGGSKTGYVPLAATLEFLTELVQEDMLRKWLRNFDPRDILFYEPTDTIPLKTVATRPMDEYRAMMNNGSLCQKQVEIREYVKAPGGGARVVSFLVQVGRILDGPISGQHGSMESKTSTGMPGEEPWYWNRLEQLKQAVKRFGPPSTNAKASSYVKYQRGFARVIDGRSSIAGLDNRAPSIELYHPVFAQLRSDLSNRNRQVRPETVRQTLKLMQSVSQLAGQENERSKSTRGLVSNLLGQQLIRVMNGNNTSPDHCVSVSLDLHERMCTVTPFILEENAETGKTATDPSVQVQLSYLQHWMDPSRRDILQACCCPTILVGLAGPHMCITGAVLLDKAVVQHFTGWMFIGEDRTTGLDQANDLGSPGVDRLAQVFDCLALAVQRLCEWYQGLNSQGRYSGRFFPWIDSYPSKGQMIKFDYIKGLHQHESCTTFLARKAVDGEEEELIVVKFVDTYGKEVHEFMAQEGLAPRLIYFVGLADRFPEQNYQGLSMVVMEHLEGDTLEAKYLDCALPSDVRRSIAQAIETLEKAGFVHGDLRRPNVMIDGEGKVKIIDFDWAGREMEVQYPLRLTSSLFPKNQGVEGRKEIRNAHDKFMVGEL